MPGSRLRIRIPVIAVGEVGPVIEQQLESLALEIGAVALQVIGAELVEHQNDHQLRMVIICARGRPRSRRKGNCENDQAAKKSLGDRHSLSSIAKIAMSQLRVTMLSLTHDMSGGIST